MIGYYVAALTKIPRVFDVIRFIPDGKQKPVGLYEYKLGVINWTGHEKIIWPGSFSYYI